MAELGVVLIGRFPRSKRQHRYLLVVIGKFTKFVGLFPLRAPTSKAILERMLTLFCRHGFPTSIFSYNVCVFVSNLCKAVMKHLSIKDRHMVPYHRLHTYPLVLRVPASQALGAKPWPTSCANQLRSRLHSRDDVYTARGTQICAAKSKTGSRAAAVLLQQKINSR